MFGDLLRNQFKGLAISSGYDALDAALFVPGEYPRCSHGPAIRQRGVPVSIVLIDEADRDLAQCGLSSLSFRLRPSSGWRWWYNFLCCGNRSLLRILWSPLRHRIRVLKRLFN